MKKKILLIICLAFFAINNQAQTVTDYEGNIYQKVTIGSQVWLKSNLKVTHYNNGDSIPNVTDGTQWHNLTTGAYLNYDNSTDTANIYGRLYNLYTVTDSRKLCPTGWHVPNASEIVTLRIAAGNTMVAGQNMKEIGTAHWHDPNWATNSTGFSALGGGNEYDYASFSLIKEEAFFWTISSGSAGKGTAFSVGHDDNAFYSSDYDPHYGFSVRCLQGAFGIDDIKKIERTNIYPIPANDKIFIDLGNLQIENVSVGIYNTIGGLLLNKEISNITNEIDLTSLSTGVYIIRIAGADWVEQKKLIKE
jgi:uncharacterized protein (TIGR02145 family)